jgi:transposase-like protein
MELTHFTSIIDLLEAFPDEQACIDHLTKLRWPNGVVSPFDPNSTVYKLKNNRYKCRNSNRYFNVKTATIFEDSKIPLRKWFLALYVFSSHKKGISSIQLGKDIKVTQKTAWFMLHRLRYAFNHPAFNEPLKGTVEADECYVGGKTANKHNNKKEYTEDGKLVDKKAPVLGMKERGGNVVAKVLNKVTVAEVHPAMINSIKKGSILYTDSASRYFYTAYYMAEHKKVNHSANEYVNGIVHTNGIENFWSHLKRGLIGIYHYASVKHLQAYVNEFAYRFNTRDLETSTRFNVVLENFEGRLKYRVLIADEGKR